MEIFFHYIILKRLGRQSCMEGHCTQYSLTMEVALSRADYSAKQRHHQGNPHCLAAVRGCLASFTCLCVHAPLHQPSSGRAEEVIALALKCASLHASVQGTMDKIRFNKMMRDARFVRECGPLSATMADHLFHRCLPMVEVSPSSTCVFRLHVLLLRVLGSS